MSFCWGIVINSIKHVLNTSYHFRYLTGDQIMSKSSTEAYITALKKGCKCIESKWKYRSLCLRNAQFYFR